MPVLRHRALADSLSPHLQRDSLRHHQQGPSMHGVMYHKRKTGWRLASATLAGDHIEHNKGAVRRICHSCARRMMRDFIFVLNIAYPGCQVYARHANFTQPRPG